MAFTPEERARIRRHLGYPNTSPAAAMSFGVPIPIETLFLVESAMDKLMPGAEGDARRFVGELEQIECQMSAARQYLAVTAMDGTQIRQDHIDALEKEYSRWQGRLADLLGVPVYAFSTRGPQSKAGNIPVC